MEYIAAMSKPSNEHKLTARTAPSIVEEVKLLVVRLARTDVKYRGRKMNIEAVVGAAMLDFLRRSPQEQESILRIRLPEIEGLFGHETENPAERVAGDRVELGSGISTTSVNQEAEALSPRATKRNDRGQ